MAGLYKWSDGEKLVQFELLLTGRAEKSLLTSSCRTSSGAIVGDREWMRVLARDLFIQGLLLKWQEKVLPSAETFADALYQARTMEEQSMQFARDLFIQGLLLKWQEKVLPSAETFADALYQARTMEEQSMQLSKMHASEGGPRDSSHSTPLRTHKIRVHLDRVTINALRRQTRSVTVVAAPSTSLEIVQ